MPLMGLREYGRHRGVTLAAVQKAIARGRIAKDADGRIDSETADRTWSSNTDPAKQRKEPAPTSPPAAPLLDGGELVNAPPLKALDWPEWPDWQPAPSSRPPAMGDGKVVDGESFMAAKTRREWAEAQRAEAKLAEERRLLVRADEARQTFHAIGRMFGQARENLPAQLAPQLVGLTDLREIEQRIRKMMREADVRIADEIQARYADMVESGERSGTGQ